MKTIRIENVVLNVRHFIKAYIDEVRYKPDDPLTYRVIVQDTSGSSWFNFTTKEDQLIAINHIEKQLALLETPWPTQIKKD